jgi:Fic-DOC domain mobile mystery protein B
MSSYLLKDRDGSTPTDPEQLSGIKFSHVTTMGELDELEDLNIQDGMAWLNRQKNIEYLSIKFLDLLHKKLFGNVWNWAGTHRKKMMNLSNIDSFQIKVELKNLFEDLKVWIEFESISNEQIAAEFHHRLISIHPYPNGNGRISRIMTEYLQKRNNWPVTGWKPSLKDDPRERRKLYISALRLADKGDYSSLVKFMKTK